MEALGKPRPFQSNEHREASPSNTHTTKQAVNTKSNFNDKTPRNMEALGKPRPCRLNKSMEALGKPRPCQPNKTMETSPTNSHTQQQRQTVHTKTPFKDQTLGAPGKPRPCHIFKSIEAFGKPRPWQPNKNMEASQTNRHTQQQRQTMHTKTPIHEYGGTRETQDFASQANTKKWTFYKIQISKLVTANWTTKRNLKQIQRRYGTLAGGYVYVYNKQKGPYKITLHQQHTYIVKRLKIKIQPTQSTRIHKIETKSILPSQRCEEIKAPTETLNQTNKQEQTRKLYQTRGHTHRMDKRTKPTKNAIKKQEKRDVKPNSSLSTQPTQNEC